MFTCSVAKRFQRNTINGGLWTTFVRGKKLWRLIQTRHFGTKFDDWFKLEFGTKGDFLPFSGIVCQSFGRAGPRRAVLRTLTSIVRTLLPTDWIWRSERREPLRSHSGRAAQIQQSRVQGSCPIAQTGELEHGARIGAAELGDVNRNFPDTWSLEAITAQQIYKIDDYFAQNKLFIQDSWTHCSSSVLCRRNLFGACSSEDHVTINYAKHRSNTSFYHDQVSAWYRRFLSISWM